MKKPPKEKAKDAASASTTDKEAKPPAEKKVSRFYNWVMTFDTMTYVFSIMGHDL